MGLSSFPESSLVTLQTFLSLQLDRLTVKPPAHAPGPKRPALAQVEAERGGKNG